MSVFGAQAVPPAHAKLTVTAWLLGADRLTVNRAVRWPLLPSTSVTSSIARRDSSLRIVPNPWPSAMVALDGLDRFKKNVSSVSSSVSPTIGTSTVFRSEEHTSEL